MFVASVHTLRPGQKREQNLIRAVARRDLFPRAIQDTCPGLKRDMITSYFSRP